MPIDGNKLRAALRQKGFVEKSDRDHIWFHLQHDGKIAGPRTKLSHSKKEMRDIRGPLANMIRKEMCLDTTQQLRDFAECPMTQALYVAHLRTKNKLPPRT